MTLHEHEIFELINQGESLTLEFKSDIKSLPDRELIAAVVALANTEGGELLLGVEDNGEITGLHANHCHTEGIPALIANKTNPSISVRVEAIETRQGTIARITVPKSRQLVSTSDGVLQRRRLMANGKPEAVPFYPHEFLQRQSSLGLADPSAFPIMEISSEDLNPLERHRIREAIRKFGGDQTLLSLADNELDGALGLSVVIDGVRRPTLAGLLLLGQEETLRRLLPAYEVAFQVLDGTDVLVNEFFHKPLLQTFEEVEQLFRSRVVEQEIQEGLFRVPIPNFDRRAFREAFVNALVHRDFNRLGAVHVRIDDNGMILSNPGGFVEGVTLQNLLVTDPRPRNPLLADIAKRLGLAERTGRGIDRIYEGLLRYGRPLPDYSRSNTTSVILRISNADADFAFLEMLLNHEQCTGKAMSLDNLIILARLREERRLAMPDLIPSIQKSEQETRAALEKLTETGLIEAHGSGRCRTYTLSAKVYSQTGQKAAYVRQAGFEPIQQEQMILSYIDKHGSIKRAEVADLCRISPFQATRLLKKLVHEEKVLPQGLGKGTYYERKT
jgi:ATP-dependent DNA helicase RecG